MHLGSGACLGATEDPSARVCGLDGSLPVVEADGIQEKQDGACALSPEIAAPCVIGDQPDPGEVSLLTVDLTYELARVAARFPEGLPDSSFEAVLDVFIAQETVLQQQFDLPGLANVTLADVDILDAPDIVEGVLGWWFRFHVDASAVGLAPGIPSCFPGEVRCDGDLRMQCADDATNWTQLEDCADLEQICLEATCVGLVERSWRASKVDVLHPNLAYDFGQGLVSVNSLVSVLLSSRMGADDNGDFLFRAQVTDDDAGTLFGVYGGPATCVTTDNAETSCAFVIGAPILSANEEIIERLELGDTCHLKPEMKAPCFEASESQGGDIVLLGIETSHRAATVAGALPLGADASGDATSFVVDVFMSMDDLQGHDFEVGGATVLLEDLLGLALPSTFEGDEGYWFTAIFDGSEVSTASELP
jgi:hypothetical protein